MLPNISKIIIDLGLYKTKKFYFLIVLILVSSIFELFTVLSFVPFINTIVNPSQELNYYNFLINYFDLSQENLFIFYGLVTLSIFFISNILLICCAWMINFFIHDLGAEIYTRLYKYYLNQKFSFHLNHTSSELSKRILQEANRVISGVLLNYFNIISKIITIIFITVMILLYDYSSALICLISLSLSYFLIYKFFRPLLVKNGTIISETFGKRVELINEGFGGIREVLLNNLQNFFSHKMSKANKDFAKAQAINSILFIIPRYIIDICLFGIILLIVIINFKIINDNNSELLITLGLFAIASYKLIPSFQQVFSAFSNIRSNIVAYTFIEKDLKESRILNYKNDISNKIKDIESIEMHDINFEYKSSYNIFENAQILFKKNNIYSISGESGSGKTSLLDLISGIHLLQKGNIKINGKEINRVDYQNNISNFISYLPQNFFILNTTIIENILLDNKNKDIAKINNLLTSLNLDNFINDKSLSHEYKLGERGSQISGGQKQRLALARSLYKNKKILLLDEFTSSLDKENELLVFKLLNEIKKDKIIIISTHSQDLTQQSDYVYQIKNKKINLIKP